MAEHYLRVLDIRFTSVLIASAFLDALLSSAFPSLMRYESTLSAVAATTLSTQASPPSSNFSAAGSSQTKLTPLPTLGHPRSVSISAFAFAI
ncbi:hypothetical protein BDV98DRAFT_572803 [Pterulicium gracile]|uniref:Uncharacterized protein n=1 Tax=Pterulicium gracile TaxID=1884261 RepID=A0A5C3QEB8_9AGAR|nr:hypothetical protein BDV98DRAFT_572803 [Pterula gracilis]